MIMKVRIPVVVILIFFFPLLIYAQSLEERVVEQQLDNGIRVIVIERHTIPTVALNILIKAGGIDEDDESRGVAHMLEHMLFKGTKTIGTSDYEREKPLLERIERVTEKLDAERLKNEGQDEELIGRLEASLTSLQEEHRGLIVPGQYESLYTRHGARGLNASTSRDYTLYTVSLPANKVELWALLESDRLKNNVLREFYTERNAVFEERRMRVDNNPHGLLSERFLQTAFADHPYGYPLIGSERDILGLNVKKARRFFEDHYVTENIVIIMVGDITPRDGMAIVERYFGSIEKRAARTIEAPPVSEQTAERRVEVAFDAEPSVLIGYHKPASGHEDDYIFDMISGLLSAGRTSRFHKNIVQSGIALYAYGTGGYPGSRGENLFLIAAAPRHPARVEDVEEAVYRELERLKNEPVSEKELARIHKLIETQFIRALESNEGMARHIAEYEGTAGSWRYILQWKDRMKKISPEDIQRVARTYFMEENRTVAVLVRK